MKIKIYRTSRDRSERIAELPSPTFISHKDLPVEIATESGGPDPVVLVDENVKYQTIEGFGGAFTEAAADTLYRMSPGKRNEVINAYFDTKNGNAYNFCRTHINSCDFSTENYAYDETDGDFELKNFTVEHDRKALLPMIKAALKIQPEIKLFASPWSPPAWMKTNGQMNKGGSLRPECRNAWAEYYCKYIKAYAKEGVNVWGLTVQNEADAAPRWDSCLYTAEEERDFVKEYLGPALHANGLGDIKLMIWDHNRDRIYERAKVAYDDPEAAKYIWGTAFHWYSGADFDNVQMVHDAYPDKHLIFTEGCKGFGELGAWGMGESYAFSIMSDMKHWTEAFVDWNMLLDETGGPNHQNNFCSAPIIADTRNDVLNYQSSYYYIGHFSRFIKRGAKRIIASSSRNKIDSIAVQNPDGSIVTVVMNWTDKSEKLYLKFKNDVAVKTEILAHSIMTFVLD